MASGALLQALAGGGAGPSLTDRYNQGVERGLRLDEIMRANEARQYVPGAVNGDSGALAKLLGLDPQTGIAVKQMQIKEDKRPSAVQEYEFARSQGYGGSFLDFQLEQKKAGGTNVNINNAPAKGETKYQEELGKNLAGRWNALAEEGDAAQEELSIVGQLRNIMPQNGGLLTGIASKAAEWGIGGEGMGDLQATQSLVDRLTPKQRVPGSGASSDLDVRMFKNSLPSLWKSAGGNAIILDTMESMALYRQARGEIAYKLMDGTMNRQQAVEAFKKLPDPFAAFKEYRKRAPAGQPTGATPVRVPAPRSVGGKGDNIGVVPQGVDPNLWQHMTPEERALWK